MKHSTIISAAAAVLALTASCTEVYHVNIESSDKRFLVVEAYLTDMPMVQTVKLTESLPFSGKDEVNGITGAKVTMSDGTRSVSYTETGSGIYSSPDFYFGEEGKTYTLSIETSDGKTYSASSRMGKFGFDIEKIDYKYSPTFSDNTWTIGAWGHNSAGNYYMVNTAVNGVSYPMDHATSLDDKYFSNASLYGYPIAYMSQGAVEEYGECAKPLEAGDIVSLICYDMPQDYYEFTVAYSNAVSSVSIPILSSQPANVPTNIQGENALGYFAACPMRIVSCLVTDPFKEDFDK